MSGTTETLQGSPVQEQRAREKSQGGGYRRSGRADMDDRRDQASGFGTSSLVLCLGNGVDAESGGGGKGFGEACGHQAFTETRHLADPVLQDGPERKGGEPNFAVLRTPRMPQVVRLGISFEDVGTAQDGQATGPLVPLGEWEEGQEELLGEELAKVSGW